MTRYLISFPSGAMDHIPHEEFPAVEKAAHAVVQEAMDAGVWVFGGGLAEDVDPIMVAGDGTITAGTYPQTKEFNGGFTVLPRPPFLAGIGGHYWRMALIVCPITVVNAAIERVWAMLTDPDSYQRWGRRRVGPRVASGAGARRPGAGLPDARTGSRLPRADGHRQAGAPAAANASSPHAVRHRERRAHKLAPLDPLHTRITLD